MRVFMYAKKFDTTTSVASIVIVVKSIPNKVREPLQQVTRILVCVFVSTFEKTVHPRIPYFVSVR